MSYIVGGDSTVLGEIEGTLNSRPLKYEYNEVGSEVLTPSHMMFGRRITTLPDKLAEEPEENESSCSERFKYLRVIFANFWKRWKNEHLVNLREFHHVKAGRSGWQIWEGDVVTVFEENKKKEEWRVAVVHGESCRRQRLHC